MEVATSIREDDGKTKVTVEMTADEVKGHIDSHFKQLAKNRIPGFRPGKAPRRVLEQNFGGHEYVYSQITSDMINDVAPLALDGEDIIFISQAEFDEDQAALVADGEPFTFTMYGEVKPALKLSSYDPVKIEMPDTSATDADVEAQLAALQQYYYDIQDVDRAAEDTDYVAVALEVTDGDRPVEELSGTDRLVEIAHPLVPKAIASKLVGAKAGDVKEFDVTIDEPEYAALVGREVHVKADVKAVRAKIVPELDDKFAEQVGFDSIDKLREELRNEIQKQKDSQLPSLKETRCVTELAKRLEGEAPESYISFSREDILRDFFNRLQRQGITFDQFLSNNGISSEEFQKDLDAEAKETAEQTLALDALFAEKGLKITDEDIDKEFQVVENPAATRKEWEESGRMSSLREALRRQKATEWLVENAEVTIVDPKTAEEDAAE